MSLTRARFSSAFLLIALVASAKPSWGAPAGSAIAPWVDDSAVAVVRINVVPTDLNAHQQMVKSITTALGLPPAKVEQAAQEARASSEKVNEMVARFNKAGGKTVYIVVGMGSPPTVKLCVPLADGADPKALTEMLTSLGGTPSNGPTSRPSGPENVAAELFSNAKSQVIGNTLFVAPEPVLAGLKDFTPAPRPELEAALAAAEDSVVAVAFNPSETLRGMAVMAMPQLPPALGGGSITAVSQGIRWISLTLNEPPKPMLRLTIQAKDAAAADKLLNLAQRGLDLGKQQLPPNTPNVDEYASALTPTVAGDQLHLTFDSDKLVALAKAAAPLAAQGKENAYRIKSNNNLRIISMATVMYANDHDGKLPINPKEDLKSYMPVNSPDIWVNPRYPDRQGYYYIRPADRFLSIQDPSGTPLYYEAFGQWRDGFAVAFADGHVVVVKDEAEFRKMLAKAQGKQQ